MNYIEYIIVGLFWVGMVVFGFTQWRKSRQAQKYYSELSEEEKNKLDQFEHERQNALHFSYTKPMTKGMWVSVIISLGAFIWVLLTKI